MGRWYDKHKKLSRYLGSLKDMPPAARDEIIRGTFALINEMEPELISADSARRFPLDIQRRRWYDDDPYLWLIFHGLEHAHQCLLETVEQYYEKHVPLAAATK
jgi:hypothetical protein